MLFVRLLAVQEVAGARLLHNLGSRVARKITEAIGTVDYGKDTGNFSVTQDKVAVCACARCAQVRVYR